MKIALLLYFFVQQHVLAIELDEQNGFCSNESLACSGGSADSCPPGFFCKKGYCECANLINKIKCDVESMSASGSAGSCVTFDEEKDIVLVGACACNQFVTHHDTSVSDVLHYPLPSSVYNLTNSTCGPFKRTGALCGRCLPEHYPLAYSFDMNCISCPNARWKWVKYVMVAYLPLTFFYILMLFFKLNTTSSHLFIVVYYSQNLTLPILLRSLLLYLKINVDNSLLIAAKVIVTVSGIWNLDFGRSFYSDICLGIDILPTLTLGYAVALYPLVLMVVSYLLIVLYDRNCKVVTAIFKPVQILFSVFSKNWNIRTSVIDAFTTLFFLTNIKFISVSYDLLVPTRVYHMYSEHYNYTLGLYYAGHIEYFGKEHLPYAIVAMVLLFIFAVLPVLVLALYPFKFFQKFLNLFPVRWYVFHTFVDAYQGCYKDGTQPGTRDCRWFASTFFIFRYCLFIMYALIHTSFNGVAIMLLSILQTTSVIMFQPFKFSHYNVMSIVFLQFQTLVTVANVAQNFTLLINPSLSSFFNTLIVVLAAVPLLYALGVTAKWLYAHKKFGFNIFRQFKATRQGYESLQGNNEHNPSQ